MYVAVCMCGEEGSLSQFFMRAAGNQQGTAITSLWLGCELPWLGQLKQTPCGQV